MEEVHIMGSLNSKYIVSYIDSFVNHFDIKTNHYLNQVKIFILIISVSFIMMLLTIFFRIISAPLNDIYSYPIYFLY